MQKPPREAAPYGGRKDYMESLTNFAAFNNPEFGEIRTVEIDGEPWFVGKDVAEALGYSNTRDSLSKHVEPEDKDVAKCDTPGGTQELAVINESGLYSLILASKLPNAKQFKHWITADVIPSIRKHGAYATPATIENIINNPDFGIKLLQSLKEEQEKNRTLAAQNEEMKPKALFADAVATADTSILIGDLAKLIRQNGYDIGQNRLFGWLRDNGYLVKHGDAYNMPTQKSMDLGLFEVKERTIGNPDGSTRITRTTKVTGKGQQYFINKFLGGAKCSAT